MKYFNSDFIDYFKDLSKNNNKEWFHQNKKRYEIGVKNPFVIFVNDLISEIRKYDTSINVEAKDCISRINRDIRFSKDKTPYNLHLNAFISKAGKKDKSIPGLYLRFSAEGVGVMVGCFGLSKQQLQNLRSTIQIDLNGFKNIYSNKELIDKFGLINGEKNKRIPKEFRGSIEDEPLIANKQFYMVSTKGPSIIMDNQLLRKLMDHWHIARPLNEYLLNGITNSQF